MEDQPWDGTPNWIYGVAVKDYRSMSKITGVEEPDPKGAKFNAELNRKLKAQQDEIARNTKAKESALLDEQARLLNERAALESNPIFGAF